MDSLSGKEGHMANTKETDSGNGAADVYIDPAKEKKMLLKFDVRPDF